LRQLLLSVARRSVLCHVEEAERLGDFALGELAQ
jgi:hypothetical protein